MKNDAVEIRQRLNEQAIAQIFNIIPPEWKLYVGEAKVEMIKTMILQRINFIDKVADVVNSERGR